MVNDSFDMKQEFSPYFVIYMDLSLGFVTWICLNLNWLLAVMGVMHEADDAYSMVMLLAGPISHTSTQCIDFVDFLHFSGSVYQLFCSF